MGATNNADSQNQKAQQQIQQNTAQAAQQIQNWIAQNPFPINMQSGPQVPGQTNQQFGGQQFGGAHGGQLGGFKPPQPPMQGQPGMMSGSPIPGMAPKPTTPPAPLPPQIGTMQGGASGGNQELIQAIRNAGLA